MEPLVIAALGVAIFVVFISAFAHAARRRPTTAAEGDSSDDETSGPLSVNVVADHDEQDSLLPKFAGLLRSPWSSVSTEQKEKQQPKVMRPVRKGSRSMSLTMPLPLRKKRKPAEVPIKKVHVPYFFPLLDETAEWWQARQPAAEPQPTPEEEPEAGKESPDKTHYNPRAEDTHVQGASSPTQMMQPDEPLHHFAVGGLAATPIAVEGR